MDELLPVAQQIAAILVDRHQTVGVAESSSGGLICAALLSVPGASAYFVGGGVVYTRTSRSALLEIPDSAISGIRASTEAYALLLARSVRSKLGTDWSVAESGASGPTGNRYGDAPGHSCVAVCGPSEASQTLETDDARRLENMYRFAAAALRLLLETAGRA